MDISKRLNNLRTAKKVSVYRLSQLSGVSETHIRDLERGDRNPSIDTISKLATAMGLSLPELLNETDNANYLNFKEQTLVECFRNLSDDKADEYFESGDMITNNYIAMKNEYIKKNNLLTSDEI